MNGPRGVRRELQTDIDTRFLAVFACRRSQPLLPGAPLQGRQSRGLPRLHDTDNAHPVTSPPLWSQLRQTLITRKPQKREHEAL